MFLDPLKDFQRLGCLSEDVSDSAARFVELRIHHCRFGVKQGLVLHAPPPYNLQLYSLGPSARSQTHLSQEWCWRVSEIRRVAEKHEHALCSCGGDIDYSTAFVVLGCHQDLQI
jgi:hypothetical protein